MSGIKRLCELSKGDIFVLDGYERVVIGIRDGKIVHAGYPDDHGHSERLGRKSNRIVEFVGVAKPDKNKKRESPANQAERQRKSSMYQKNKKSKPGMFNPYERDWSIG